MTEPTPGLDGRLFAAAREGDVDTLAALLDAHPDRLHARSGPYAWTLLHLAAHAGRLAAVELLLGRGLDVNAREEGDDTYAMHWAAAAGHLDVVRRLADAGGDVVGRGDDHGLEVIGWATCWEGCDDAAHRAVADFLVARGARHHVFSAVAMGLEDEVRRIVAEDPGALRRPMSRNEDFQLPLHFAARMSRPEMVALLLELGADPAATDGSGASAAVYAAAPGVDRRVIEILARHGGMGLFGALALGDRAAAARMVAADPGLLGPGGAGAGALHLLAKRGDAPAVEWLLARGADPDARWDHGDARVTPLHLAAAHGHARVVRLLLAAGADPRIRDGRHDGDAMGWAEHSGQDEVAEILRAHAAKP
jgi:ankyrin repeat protein